MTTQNFTQDGPYTFSNLAIGTYYYPSAAGVSLDGYDHLTIHGSITGGAGTTVTLTVWSDTGALAWSWNETMGFYNWNTGLWGTASFVAAPGATTLCRLQAWNHNAALWRVQIQVAGGALNSGIIEIRKIKV